MALVGGGVADMRPGAGPCGRTDREGKPVIGTDAVEAEIQEKHCSRNRREGSFKEEEGGGPRTRMMAAVSGRGGQSYREVGRPESRGGYTAEEEGRRMLEWQVKWSGNEFSSVRSLCWKAKGKGC